jgi:hypothetical protein
MLLVDLNEGQLLGFKAGLLAHARQFKRMRKII